MTNHQGFEQDLISQSLLSANDEYKILLVFLRHIKCIIFLGRVKWLLDRKIEINYKKFQFKLKLSEDTIDYAQRLHGELIEKIPFKYESPYLIAASCILTVSLIEEQQKTFKEFSEVSHIKEADLRQCYHRVFEEIEARMKRL